MFIHRLRLRGQGPQTMGPEGRRGGLADESGWSTRGRAGSSSDFSAIFDVIERYQAPWGRRFDNQMAMGALLPPTLR